MAGPDAATAVEAGVMTPERLHVIELASGEGASYAARFLHALGARVTKVLVGQRPNGSLAELDSNKELITLGQAAIGHALLDLTSDADVVVLAGPASDMDAEPLRLPDLRLANPRLVTAAITPFGESGPHCHYKSTDLIATHAGGLGYGTPPRIVEPEKEHPLGIPGDVIEPLSGLVLVVGVLDALLERDRDGKGRHVELSAQEVVAALMFNNIATFVETGSSPGRLASDRPAARRPFLACADGLLVQMAGRPRHLRSWLQLLGKEARQAASRLERTGAQARLSDAVNEIADSWAASKTRREVTDLAQTNHIPIEPVLNPAEVLDCPQLAARGFWEVGPGGERVAGHPFGPLSSGQAAWFLPRNVSPPPKERTWHKAEPREGPLSGIRVLDFTWVFAGPIASRILAALGATVVKVEAAEGNNESGRPFLSRTLHGGKLSISCDLADPEHLASVRKLASECDVLIENFSTGVMDRHGLGWEELSKINPRAIMVSISGMGRTGPYAHHVMFGQLAQGYSGLTSIIGYEGGPPRGIEDGGFWSDPVTGYAAAAAALAALRQREVTGIGRRIDVSLVEATVSTLFRPLLAAVRGDVWGPRGNFHPLMAPHDVYRCGPSTEDSWVAIACRSDEDWERLADLVGGGALATDGHFRSLEDRQANRDELRQAIELWTRQLSADEAARACQNVGVAAAPCQTTRDVVEDEHLLSRGFVVQEGSAPLCVALPWRVARSTSPDYSNPPRAGEHTDLAFR